jgi:transcriptional regulator with XRE-family HTH domain
MRNVDDDAAQRGASDQDNERNERQRQWLIALGRRIRALRAERKFSQVAFAVRAGFARAYYSSVERGERNVSAVNLVRIAKALGVEVGELFPPLSSLPDDDGELHTFEEYELENQVKENILSVESVHKQPTRTGEDETTILVSAGMAARMLGVNRRTVERWVRDGVLGPAARIEDQRGKLYAVFLPEEIERVRSERRSRK